MPYLSASAVVIHYEEALYQVYAPLPFAFRNNGRSHTSAKAADPAKFLVLTRRRVKHQDQLGPGRTPDYTVYEVDPT